MRGNALLLKTPVENAPRTSIEKHLSWSSDIPPTALFPLHRSRPAEYQPNRQPATVCTERGTGEARQRVGRRRGLLTSGARQSLCVLVIQSSTPDRGQHLTVPISTNDFHCHSENPHAPPRHSNLPDTSRAHDNWKTARQTSCLQQTAPPQQ
jgi:hypothetical protein